MPVHCASEIGVKQRHDGVRDVVYDLCRRAGITSQREVDVGMVDCNGK